MEIKFVGTGGAFDAQYGNSSAVIRIGNKTVLLDCGSTVFSSLQTAQLLREIDYVLITHFHDDHIGSLSTLLFYYYVYLKEKEVIILYPTSEFKTMLINYLTFSMISPEKYCSFQPITSFPYILPIDTFGLHVPGLVSYAYYFQEANQAILYSGDIAHPTFLYNFILEQNLQPDYIFHEISFFPSSVHSYYREVFPYLEIAPTFGYHCDPSQNPSDNIIPLVYNSSFLFSQSL
ncbi:MAG: MBL fold metallo-hydrolase [Bacteroidia bacterium]|nr:MBL fold metallo-hydrolase [Bacteroidia bacterium]MDW8159146.1 MBL fold metallo-hydrolase [Bacteroidia bacterium]